MQRGIETGRAARAGSRTALSPFTFRPWTGLSLDALLGLASGAAESHQLAMFAMFLLCCALPPAALPVVSEM